MGITRWSNGDIYATTEEWLPATPTQQEREILNHVIACFSFLIPRGCGVDWVEFAQLITNYSRDTRAVHISRCIREMMDVHQESV